MRGRRIVGRPGAARAWRWMLLLALIGMALSSLGGAIAASQANPPPITQEEAADQPAIETAEPAATQPAAGVATAPAVQPDTGPGGQQVNQPPVGRAPGEAPFFLQLIKRVCPAKEGFVPESAPYAELDDGCRLELSDPSSFFFIVTDATGAQQVANDIAPFFELPTGRTRAAEKHAGGYGDPVVFCSFGKGEPPQRMPVVDRGVALDPRPDMLVSCVFFNPELPPGPDAGDDDGSITVVKVACPPGYDPTARGANPAADCARPLDDVGFALIPADPGIEPRKGRTGDDGRGTLTFDDLPAGSYALEERLPAGFDKAAVWTCTDDPGRRQRVAGPFAEGTRLEVDLAAGQDLWCLWLNIAEKRPAEPTLPLPTEEPTPTPEPTEPTGDGGSLTIDKWACPEGASNAQDTSWYADNCTTPMSGIVFEVVADSGTASQATDESGRVVWPELPEGLVSVREGVPADYGDPVVVCRIGEASPSTGQPAKEGTIQIEVGAAHLHCHWYNIPVPTDAAFVLDPTVSGTSVIRLETPAPASTEVATIEPTERPGAGSGTGDLIVIVTDADGQPIGGACIALIDAAGTVVAESCDTAEWEQASLAGNGATGFFGVPAGEYTVRLVSVPGGGAADDGAAAVTAGGSAQVAMTVEAPAPEPTLPMPWTPTPAPTPDEAVNNEGAGDAEALAGSGRVRVSIYLCPPAMAYDMIARSAEARPAGAGGICQPMIGEGIVLRHADETGTGTVSRTRMTNTHGGVFWGDGVPQGPWTLIRAPWQGYEGDPLVMCRYVDPPQGVDDGWRVHPAVEGGVYGDAFVAADMLAECFWYVIPAVDPGGANRIHLTVYDCPAGTDAAIIAGTWPVGGARDCTLAESVEVSLAYAGRNGVGTITRPLVTNESGVAFWSDGVPTAPWSISRGAGSGDALVACRYDAVPGAEPGWRFDLVVADGAFTSSFAGVYDHPPGQQADLLDRCHWFSIPSPGG